MKTETIPIEMPELDDENKHLWEIINPSDPYTIMGTERVVAYLLLLVGRGKLGARRNGIDRSAVGSLCIFASEGEMDKIINHLTSGLESKEFLKKYGDHLIEACRSVLIGDENDRETWEAVMGEISDPEERRKAWDVWHDKKRTSMADIGQSIMNLAHSVEELMKEGERDDQ